MVTTLRIEIRKKKKVVPYFGELNKVIHRKILKGFVIFLFLYNNKPGSKRGCASQ